jgi:Zn-dependent M28 family amino/carboxypeptidase
MVGAQLDSVTTGPGIQDNGSGTAAILEVAEQMAKTNPRNKVRFAWWGAEETGLLGSTYYVNGLSQEEKDRISVYLNFDMIGSPNFVRFVYTGAGVSGATQGFFEGLYASRGLAYELIPSTSVVSAHLVFIGEGIPAGGLFTGAEGIKTAEQEAIYGGSAGDQYDPCYHLACDTFDNISLEVLDQNGDAVAAAGPTALDDGSVKMSELPLLTLHRGAARRRRTSIEAVDVAGSPDLDRERRGRTAEGRQVDLLSLYLVLGLDQVALGP